LADVAFPDGANVAKVIAAGSRFIAIRADTGKFYWTDPLEADVEALDFATAEAVPDNALDLLWHNGMLWIFGTETVEPWQVTDDPDLPFVPITNMTFNRGIKATGCVSQIGPSFAWVGNDGVVYLGDVSNAISNEGLVARILASSAVRLFSFPIDGVEFLALRLDDETHVWRVATQTWHEFATYGQDNWIAQCYAGGSFGSALDGQLLRWGTEKADEGATSGIMERRLTAGFPLNGGGQMIDSLALRMNPGETPYLTGTFADPVVEMRMSRDAGRTWGTWRSRGLGAASIGGQGEYRTKVEWRGLGMASRPGFLVQFRCTDPVPFRISDVLVNEPRGGR
jgi:hypothetical protein